MQIEKVYLETRHKRDVITIRAKDETFEYVAEVECNLDGIMVDWTIERRRIYNDSDVRIPRYIRLRDNSSTTQQFIGQVMQLGFMKTVEKLREERDFEVAEKKRLEHEAHVCRWAGHRRNIASLFCAESEDPIEKQKVLFQTGMFGIEKYLRTREEVEQCIAEVPADLNQRIVDTRNKIAELEVYLSDMMTAALSMKAPTAEQIEEYWKQCEELAAKDKT